MIKLPISLILGILFIALAGVSIVTAQIDVLPGPDPVNATVEYTPPGQIKWFLVESNDEEIVELSKITDLSYTAKITPTSKLPADDYLNYPIEMYTEIYDDEGNVIEKRPISGVKTDKISTTKDYIDLNTKNTLTVTAPDEWEGELFLKVGPNSTTYAAGTNIITVTGTGNFEAVYQADLAGGWGVVTRQGTRQFHFDAALYIGDGAASTVFNDESAQVIFTTNAIYTGLHTIRCNNNSTTTFGRLQNASYKTTSHGCDFLYTDTSDNNFFALKAETGADVFLYSCNFHRYQDTQSWNLPITGLQNGSRIWNCLLSRGAYLDTFVSGVDIYNTTIQHGSYGFRSINSGVDINDCKVNNVTYGTLVPAIAPGTIVITNTDFTDLTTSLTWANNSSVNLHYINCNSTEWTTTWTGLPTTTIERQYTFDLIVQEPDGTPINGALVEMWTQGGTLVVTAATSASGSITSQNITYVEYTSSGSITHSPHRIRVTRNSFNVYEDVFNIDEEMSLHIALTESGTGTVMTTEWAQLNIIDWLEGDMAFIAQVLLVALLLGLAHWRKALMVWLIAGIGTGLMAGIWFEDNTAYGIPFGILSIYCFVPIVDQVWNRKITLY